MYKQIINKQRLFFSSNLTKNYNFRMLALNKLEKMIILNEDLITQALNLDLGKSKYESYVTEIALILKEIRYFKKQLSALMKPIKVKTPLTLFKAKSYLYPEPLGVVLIIAPWNYPFLLSLLPLVGALAAGNTAIIKPSEVSVHSEAIIKRLIEETFDSALVTTVCGGAYQTSNLLDEKFDYIFFTGSSNVATKVMEKAAINLTPVTLELGGKSPVIITKDTNIKTAARKIAFGKTINAGQTCIAPDYLLIDSSQIDQFIIWYSDAIKEFFGKDVLKNDGYPKIINQKHHQRLLNYLSDGRILCGGKFDDHKIEPTLILTSNLDSEIMREEIFGPILPIIVYHNYQEAIDIILKYPKPLASYVFSNDEEFKKTFLTRISSGSVIFNDTIIQFLNPNLGFGGVGASGIGKYQGIWSFNTFSHYKTIIDKKELFDFKLRYHPYSDKKFKWARRLLK